MEVVSMAAEIYASAAGTIAQIWILSELFPRKQSVKKVYIVGWILLNFCIAHFVLLPNIWQSLLGMGVMLLMSCIMLEGKTEQKMLVIIACNVFMILVSMLRGRITFFLSGKSINEISIQGSESLARVLGILLTNTLYLVTAYILTRFFHDKIKLKKEEYIIVIIFYIIFLIVVLLSIAMSRNVDFSLIWQKTFLILDMLMFIANIIVLKMIFHINQQNHYEMENALLYMQITQQEKRIREEEKNYREVQLLRHDLKRYLVTYRQLLQEGKYEVIEADIDKILGKRLNTNHCVYTENTILNAVICEKMEQCSIKNIKIEVQVNADKDMDSIEYGVVLSNLLDNAIEAEEQEKEENRYICLNIGVEQNMIHLVVSNYISESVLQNNALLETSKKNKQLHGIGLRGVKEFVNNKEGEIEIFEENHMFVVHICVCV
jgi:two-component system sensor histidine kinase AgrC